VIATFKRLEPPDVAEGFDELYVVSQDENGQLVVAEISKESAKREKEITGT